MKIKFNRILKITVVLIFFAALLFKISYKPAYACSCAKSPLPLEAKERATAVFAGKVISQEPSQFQVKVNFRVQRIWKGEIADTVTITTASNSAACGMNFRIRESYLVYAFSNQNELITDLCSRTQPLYKAREDLKELGAGIRQQERNVSVLNNTNWQLERLNNQRSIGDINVFFENSLINGNTGCNFYNGAYKEKGNAIRFGPLATTRMACIDRNLQQQESNYLEALSNAYSFKIDRDRLIVDYYDGRNEGILVYLKINNSR